MVIKVVGRMIKKKRVTVWFYKVNLEHAKDGL